MRIIPTEILVIGGGATGSGVARDLAMRGFQTVLVERGDLSEGTTGRYHGLLHSGGRYAVKDPLAAQECIQENRILRRIMPGCIEDTGGFFVQTPGDDPLYAEKFAAACQQSGIPCEDVSLKQMLREEPRLNPAITRCFRVPDGAADSFLAADLNAASARAYGATVLKYHPVLRLLTETTAGEDRRRVCGALCHDRIHDEEVEIHADLVINAAGAWAGQIAGSAGIAVQMIPGKGTMVAVNHRIVHTVINRLKMPGDGDILVPAHTVAVIGTTDVKVPDADNYAIEPWEVQLMLEEGEKLIPGFKKLRFLRAWAGVRPLYQEARWADQPAQNRDVTRAFVLLDHETRDGVAGLLTITGGKWTTYRKMAEVTVDKVCEKLNSPRPCRTHLEALPSAAPAQGGTGHAHSDAHSGMRTHSDGHAHSLGQRLAEIEREHAYGQLICECELATRRQVADAIRSGDVHTLDDIRRDVRLGMGPCQSGFCALRAAGLMAALAPADYRPAENGKMLRDFLQERWKGLTPILWGQQLRQERLNELMYLDVLNVDHLGEKAERRAAASQAADERPGDKPQSPASRRGTPAGETTLVIGGGLSGLSAAWQAARHGQSVTLISKGWGANHWGAGCVDLLGYAQGDLVQAPRQALQALIQAEPRHPYALAGLETIEQALHSLQTLCQESNYPLHGSLAQNWLLPTAAGALRPTCLAPETMIAGDCRQDGRMLIVGFEPFLDFWPQWIAGNLQQQGLEAEGVLLDMPGLRARKLVNGLILAGLFDQADFRRQVAAALQSVEHRRRLAGAQRIGFPAVLGLRHALEAKQHLESLLGAPVFEIPGLPPSIPGLRLHHILIEAVRKSGGQVFEGMLVTDKQARPAEGSNGPALEFVLSEAAARPKAHRAGRFILATGGILGGGYSAEADGSLHESALGLPLAAPQREAWLQARFLAAEGHAVFRAGLAVNAHFQPVNADGQVFYENLYAAGGAIGGFDPLRERSLEGAALATGYAVGAL